MSVRASVRRRFRVLIDWRNRLGQSDSETRNRPGQSDSGGDGQGEGPAGGGTGGGVKGGVFFFFSFRFFWVLPPFLGGGWSGVATGYLHSYM